jgi:hypothetical protein
MHQKDRSPISKPLSARGRGGSGAHARGIARAARHCSSSGAREGVVRGQASLSALN